MTRSENHPPILSIALLSACALAYEVLLTRLFSIIQWHHFAFMIISLALLGYGAGGTFLAEASRRLQGKFGAAYPICTALFGACALTCYLLAQRMPFNAEEVLWNPRQFFYLSAIYLLLALPFFFGATAIGLALMQYRDDISRLYAADLLGAGLGAALIIGLFHLFFPATILRILSAAAMAAAALAHWEINRRRKIPLALLTAAIIPLLLPPAWLKLELSPYKGLSQALRITGANVVHRTSGPLGLLSVVESPVIPFRHAPGLSLTVRQEPPEQLGVFTDGDGMTVINHDSGDMERFAYLDGQTSAAAYHLRPIRRVLVLGAGGGSEVLQARYHKATDITAIELNPQLAALLRQKYAGFCGHLYQNKSVNVHIGDARGFLADSGKTYDLIQMALLDAFGASSAGLYALSENYLYTVEALQEYIRHLSPGGVLAITRWVKLPPRDNLKLFATAVSALRKSGAAHPENRLLLIRSWQTCTLMIKNGNWRTEEIRDLKAFCRSRNFDTAYYPGIASEKITPYNRLPQPYFRNGTLALLGPNAVKYLAGYKFNLQPATDDKPFFFHFFKWKSLPEIISLLGRGGMSLLESGYIVLLAALLQAVLFSGALILMPLLRLKKDKDVSLPFDKNQLKILGFFFLIGLAFLFLEIAFIQKFILFLHHPIYAVTVILAAFLVFAGMGSLASQRFARSNRQKSGIRTAIFGLILFGSFYAGGLTPLFKTTMTWPWAAKITLSLLLIGPLAFCMGIPFPLGLSLISRTSSPHLLPWAWGVNGCASVLSAILAALLALHFGFTAVILSALFFYGLAAVVVGN